MNIFATSECPVESAYNLPHIHAVSQIKESCQMLSTAHRLLGSDDERLYKIAQPEHPCNLWVKACKDNYMWLLEHLQALSEVYTLRSGKVHGSVEKTLSALLEPPRAIPESTFVYQGLPTAVMKNKDILSMSVSTKEKYQLYLNWKYLEWIKEGNRSCKNLVWSVDYPEWLDKSIVEYSEKLRG